MAKGKPPPPLCEGMLLPNSVRHNAGIVNFIGVFASLVAGLVAGILGVEGWIGFVYYVAAQVVVAFLLYTKAGGQPLKYHSSTLGLLFGDALSSTMLLTFILFWTLSHNYVHLF